MTNPLKVNSLPPDLPVITYHAFENRIRSSFLFIVHRPSTELSISSEGTLFQPSPSVRSRGCREHVHTRRVPKYVVLNLIESLRNLKEHADHDALLL